jgi:hypothetical protein
VATLGSIKTFGLCVVVATAIGNAVSAQQNRPQEYQVKSAYLSSFGKFVEWPTDAPASGGSFLVCVLGQDPFGPTLDRTVANAVVHNQRVAIKRLTRPQDGRACQIVFISASEDARLRSTLDTLRGSRVLTVGETPAFAERGGMIEFTVDGNRVRFLVNLTAAQDAGLMLNSELLRVASGVLKGGQPGR